MVLWDLIHKSGHEYAVAHVNYHLRGEESNLDAQLVSAVAKTRNTTFHLFDDRSLTKNNAGLQAQARKIRYEFFEKFKHLYPLVCTAHHADDQVETVLLQLGRGGGPKALAGISSRSTTRLRPLLPFTKAALSAYAKSNNISYRDDQSNASDDYLRNRIRHHLAPLAEKMFDGFRQNIVQSSKQQQALLAFAEQMVKEKVNDLSAMNWPHTLDRDKVMQLEGRSYLFHELLRKHDFSPQAVSSIVLAIGDKTLKKRLFFNKVQSVCLVLTGQTLHLELTKPFKTFALTISKEGTYNSPLGTLTVTKGNRDEGFDESETWVEHLENLTWRTSTAEDCLKLSANQTKTVKRVLAEAKLPTLEKCASSSLIQDMDVLCIVNVRKSVRSKESKAKAAGYRLRFTSPFGRPGVLPF